ncbi:(2Fe-2S)-binding protein [Fluviispira multicolorata]|nr:(2Fe-2S)-binding protein [Fluviispira multicolorata]
MLMCLCYGISCHEIKKLMENGKTTTEDIQRECNAGLGCGCCLDALVSMVESEVSKKGEISMSSSHAIAEPSSSLTRCL